ncbi:MAG: hypothetical protein FWE85_02660 [Clostridiales bacterium]|nr:hypothetical protein [Clostridiales bacterium]
MLMSDLRRMAKKNRGVMLTVVVILCIGLLSSYAMMSSWGLKSGSSTASAMEKAIQNTKKALESKPNDYALNLQLGNQLFELGEHKRLVLNANWLEYRGNYLEAVDAYEKAWEHRPTTLTSKERANIKVLLGLSYYRSGNYIDAEAELETATLYADKDLEINLTYIYFFEMQKTKEMALNKARAFKERLEEGDLTTAEWKILNDYITELEKAVGQA